MIKVKGFKKLKSSNKKYEITFEKNGKTYVRKFGASGMSDFTIHKDRERRERYISRHKKDLRTGDPMKPGYLSMYILWNKPTLKASLEDYKRRLGTYNRTGKFPKEISGSKKLKFGTGSIPFEQTSLNVLPSDIQNLIRDNASAGVIQDRVRKYDPKRSLIESLKIHALTRYKETLKRTSRSNKNVVTQLWTNLDPVNDFTSKWLTRASKVLIKSDLDFATRNLWWKIVDDQIASMAEMEEDGDPSDYLPQNEYMNYEKCQTAIMKILNKAGYPITDDDIDEGWANEALNWWRSKRTNAFGKKYKVPDNVINKKLYDSIKTKIRRSIKGRRWGAYDSGRLVREYKSAGGGYTGKKGKTNLDRWYKEKWVDACAWPKRKPCGRKTAEKIAYCRPSVKVDSKTPKLVQELTKTQIKSRCAKKKRSPMKRINQFGTIQVLDKMRQQMYNEIMAFEDISKGIENTISKRCKRGFQDSFCQSIFTDLLLSIYYTVVKNSILTNNRKQNLSEMEKFIPNNFKPTILKINKTQFLKIDELLYSLQDHSYGTFKNARAASLIYEYIHNK